MKITIHRDQLHNLALTFGYRPHEMMNPKLHIPEFVDVTDKVIVSKP